MDTNNQLANQSPNYSKQQIVEYVEQMEELESREFTLRKMAEELRKESKIHKVKVSERISFYKNRIQIVKRLSERAEKHCQEAINPPKMMNEIQEDNWKEQYNEEKWALREDIKYYKNNPHSGFLMGEPERMKNFFIKKGHKFEKEPFKLDPPQKPENYEEMKNAKEPKLPLFSPGGFFGFCLVITLFLGIPLGVGICVPHFGDTKGLPLGLILGVVLCFVLPLALYLPWAIPKDKKWSKWWEKHWIVEKYEKALSDYNSAAHKYEHLYLPLFYLFESFRYEIEQAEKNKESYEQYRNKLEEQARFFEQQAEIIAEQKKEMYKISIVPPAYRNLDCIIMVKSIFENDLADTMREAIMIYDDRVFKGLVITGIQKIYEMLGQLAYSMKAIDDHLLAIRGDVAKMTNEVCRMVDVMNNSTEVQDNLLNEARAIKYAMESVERSNELLLLHQNRVSGNYYV